MESFLSSLCVLAGPKHLYGCLPVLVRLEYICTYIDEKRRNSEKLLLFRAQSSRGTEKLLPPF